MIVADSNLIAACVLESEATASARELRQKESDWRVPRLWSYEIQNILSTMIKAGRIDAEESINVYSDLLTLFKGREMDPEPGNVFELVAKHGITGYDAQFVSLALELGCTLYTQDKEILRKFPDVAKKFYARFDRKNARNRPGFAGNSKGSMCYERNPQ